MRELLRPPRPISSKSSTIRKIVDTIKSNAVHSSGHNISNGTMGTIVSSKQSLVYTDPWFKGEINYSASYQPGWGVSISEEKHWPQFGFTSSVGIYVARSVVPAFLDFSGITSQYLSALNQFNNRASNVCYAPFDGQENYSMSYDSGSGPQFQYWTALVDDTGTSIYKGEYDITQTYSEPDSLVTKAYGSDAGDYILKPGQIANPGDEPEFPENSIWHQIAKGSVDLNTCPDGTTSVNASNTF